MKVFAKIRPDDEDADECCRIVMRTGNENISLSLAEAVMLCTLLDGAIETAQDYLRYRAAKHVQTKLNTPS